MKVNISFDLHYRYRHPVYKANAIGAEGQPVAAEVQ